MIRNALPMDLYAIHAFGSSIPELRVNDADEFMSKDELLEAIESRSSVFLVASNENQVILGFAYACIGDIDRGHRSDEACFVYLATHPKRCGLGNQLCESVLQDLKAKGVRHVYAWAHPKSGVIEFMQKHGFRKGHAYVWMDRDL